MGYLNFKSDRDRQAVCLFHVETEEDMLNYRIRELESAQANERNERLIKALRAQRTELIVRNISRY